MMDDANNPKIPIGGSDKAAGRAPDRSALHQLLDDIDRRNAPTPARTTRRRHESMLAASRRGAAHTAKQIEDFAINARYYSFFEMIRRIEWIEQTRVRSDRHPLGIDDFLSLKSDNRLRFAKADLTRVKVIEPGGETLYATRPGRTRKNPTTPRSSFDLTRTQKRPRGLALKRGVEERPLGETWPYRQRRYEIEVAFFGVHGAHSPLPSPTVEALARGGNEENVRKDFFDFFHHHWLKYLYQIWRKYRYAIAFEPGGTDLYSKRILALAGLYPDELRTDDGIHWSRLLGYAGLMMIRTKAPHVLQSIVAQAFFLKTVTVREFVRQWVMIPRRQRCLLGKSGCTLGVDGSLGARVLNHSAKFAIEVGPVSIETFYELLPGKPKQRALKRLVEFLLRDQLSFDLMVNVDTRRWQEKAGSPLSSGQIEARQERGLGVNDTIELGRSLFLGQITQPQLSVILGMGR